MHVIIDSQEKIPYTFSNSNFVKETTIKKIPTGDYTVDGFETELTIERKAYLSELVSCMSQNRFMNEMKRMQEFKYRFLICEFALQEVLDWPHKSHLPQSTIAKIKITPQYIMKFLSEMQVYYGIQTLYCGNRKNAEYTVLNIMRRVHERTL